MTGGPVEYLGLWDSSRDGATLFEATCTALERQGATLERTAATAPVRDDRLPPNPEPAHLHVLPTHNGGLVEYAISLSEVDGDESYDWGSLNRELEMLILDVAPTLATFSVEYRPEALPLLDWDDANEILSDGWVNLESCTPTQRAAFAALPDLGLTHRLGRAFAGRIRSPPTRVRVPAPQSVRSTKPGQVTRPRRGEALVATGTLRGGDGAAAIVVLVRRHAGQRPYPPGSSRRYCRAN